jgi:hypothetical protein
MEMIRRYSSFRVLNLKLSGNFPSGYWNGKGFTGPYTILYTDSYRDVYTVRYTASYSEADTSDYTLSGVSA